MPVPNAPSVAKVALVGHRDNREWVNTLHVHKNVGDMTSDDMASIAALVYDWWHNFYRLQLPPACALDQIQVRALNPITPYALDYTTNLPEAGTRTGANNAPEAANVTLAMSERTGLAGRKYRGRFYAAGICEQDATTQDAVTTGLVALAVQTMQELLATFFSSAFALTVFHKSDNTWTNVISFVIDAILDSQRRRLPGRGR